MNSLSYNLRRTMRTSAFGRSWPYLAIRYFVKRKQIDKFIKIYEGDVTPKRKSQIKKLMFEAMTKYRWDFNEFFMFHYENISDEKRRSFVPEFDKNVFCDLINEPKSADVFLDKWETYLNYSEFYKRDIYNVRSLWDIESNECTQFIDKHPRLMLKPVFEALGRGIQIIDREKYEDVKKELIELYKSGVKAFILEELIVQDPKLAELHPASVNTLRIRTICVNGDIRFIHPSLRMGRSNAFIDNAGAGGIMGNIDVETGCVYEACDKIGNRYECHPDTKTKIIGFQIPKWNEALETAKSMASKNPSVKYVGWDMALSKSKGWVMIEGNDKGQWGFQYVRQEGFRDEMNAILRELGKPEIN